MNDELSEKFIGGDREGTFIAPGKDASWIRIALTVAPESLEKTLALLKPLLKKHTVLLSGTAQTPSKKIPVLVLEAADKRAIAKVKRMVGSFATVTLLDKD